MMPVRQVWPVTATPTGPAGPAGLGNILERRRSFLKTSNSPRRFHLEELKLHVCVCVVARLRHKAVRTGRCTQAATDPDADPAESHRPHEVEAQSVPCRPELFPRERKMQTRGDTSLAAAPPPRRAADAHYACTTEARPVPL